MARTPPRYELAGMLMPRERVWEAVRKVGAGRARFTAWTIQDACMPMVQFATAARYLRCLARAGYLRQTKASVVQREHGARHSTPEYELIKDAFDAPQVDANGKQVHHGMGVLAMWRAMRVHKTFDFRDIARAATLPPVTVSDITAQKYVNYLAQAGYLQQLSPATRRVAARYRLIRNTGPQAPAITRRKVVFDRNTGEFADLQTAQEVCDGLE